MLQHQNIKLIWKIEAYELALSWSWVGPILQYFWDQTTINSTGQSPFEKLTVPQLVRKFHTMYEN
jgi:hypothetical protein